MEDILIEEKQPEKEEGPQETVYGKYFRLHRRCYWEKLMWNYVWSFYIINVLQEKLKVAGNEKGYKSGRYI